MKDKKNKNKGLTLAETLVSISIISLLLAIMLEITFMVSKYNKKVGYVQEGDIKAKEIAVKIERIIYNQNILAIKIINYNVLCIYTIQPNQITLVEFYYQKNLINRKYYRRINVFFPKTGIKNFTYIPDNVFWKISTTNVLRKTQVYRKVYETNYLYNFDSTPVIKTQGYQNPINYRDIFFQNLSIGFYVYNADPRGREFSKYVKDPNWKNFARGMLVYFINIINLYEQF